MENPKCDNLLQNDVDSYTEEQYEQMEKELAEKINRLIEETENKYCVLPQIETKENRRKVNICIMNKGIHNNPPITKN